MVAGQLHKVAMFESPTGISSVQEDGQDSGQNSEQDSG